MERKKLIKDKNHLASVIAKMEGKKSQATIGDIREILKILIALDAASFMSHKKSVLIMLRKEALKIAKEKKK